METPLSGGRITPGVMRKGDTVYRPACENADFVHRVLQHLERKGLARCPRFIGLNESGREITTYLDGETPLDLGTFSDEQCAAATSIIKALHAALLDFPGCMPGQTVCHGDLSPCNFRFMRGLPYAVFDWDTAAAGDPLDDLAYAVWMWLDIGNEENEADATARRIKLMLDGYGVNHADRLDFFVRMAAQMRRVANGRYPTMEQAAATKAWAENCEYWLKKHEKCIQMYIV